MTTQKLDDLHLIMLSAASQHKDGSLIPLPAAAVGDPVRANKAIAALIRKGLAEEMPIADRNLAWRDAGEDPTGVFITAAGREAIGVGATETKPDPAAAALVACSVAMDETAPSVSAPRKPNANSKIEVVLNLLRRTDGATIFEMVEATGWLPHTTRAVLTGLRKKGNAINRGKRGDVTCYNIAVSA